MSKINNFVELLLTLQGEAPPEFAVQQTDSTTAAAVNTILNPQQNIDQTNQQPPQPIGHLQQPQQKQFPPPLAHPAGIPRERETTLIIPPKHTESEQSAAFVPFGKRPLEFVTCFKVSIFLLSARKFSRTK